MALLDLQLRSDWYDDGNFDSGISTGLHDRRVPEWELQILWRVGPWSK
jgi:hypothetical protein